MNRQAAVFLDRDGVVNREKNYLFRISEFEFVEGVFENCRRFVSQGFQLVIVTNQAGIARGYYDERDYNKLTNWMRDRFFAEGIKIDAIYHCPHHPEGNVTEYTKECSCRKPKPGMLLQAQKDLDLDLVNSIMVGDKISDVSAGVSAGVGRNILVRTGHSLDAFSADELKKFEVVDGLSDIKVRNTTEC